MGVQELRTHYYALFSCLCLKKVFNSASNEMMIECVIKYREKKQTMKMINFDFVEEGLPDNWSVCLSADLAHYRCGVSNGAKGQLGLIFDEKFLEEVNKVKRIQSK